MVSLLGSLLSLHALACGCRAAAVHLPRPIVLDGAFDDWDGAAPLAADRGGDAPAGGLDFGRLWVADDARQLFLRLEFASELQLDEENEIVLYLDTDGDAGTGLAVEGIGAELEWRCGERRGRFYRGRNVSVSHADIGFRSLPTVSSTDHELSIARHALPDGSHPLLPGPRIRMVLRDLAPGGDRLPDGGAALDYTMDQGPAPPTAAISLARQSLRDVRVTTQNVLRDALFESPQPKFERLYAVVAPDIVNLQEIYDHPVTETQALFEDWLGGAWYAASHQDCQTLSRFPIEGQWAIDGNLAVLLDTRDALDRKLLLVNAHLPCCANDAGRLQEIDHLRELLGERSSLDPDGLAVLVAGDLNLVGSAAPLRALLSAGPVELRDLVSRHTHERTAYTWRSDASDYWPGRLDFLLYDARSLAPQTHFVLATSEMPADLLSELGLRADDAGASDHLLHVGDFAAADPSSSQVAIDEPVMRLALAPNPSRGVMSFSLELPSLARAKLEIVDPSGRVIARPWERTALSEASRATFRWPPDTAAFNSLHAGIYWARLSGETPSGAWLRRSASFVQLR